MVGPGGINLAVQIKTEFPNQAPRSRSLPAYPSSFAGADRSTTRFRYARVASLFPIELVRCRLSIAHFVRSGDSSFLVDDLKPPHETVNKLCVYRWYR